ncbi:hypothetical protein VHTUMSATKI_32270 [Vibrio harveyi]
MIKPAILKPAPAKTMASKRGKRLTSKMFKLWLSPAKICESETFATPTNKEAQASTTSNKKAKI